MLSTFPLQTNATSTNCAAYFPTNEADDIRIALPENGSPRYRNVVSRSRARKTKKVPSWKMSRMIQAESDNERIAYRILDGDSTVKAFYEQPFKVNYLDDGVIRHHFPDVLIDFYDGTEVWEIKDSLDSDCQDTKKRTELLARLFKQFGIRYRLVSINKKHLKGVDAYSFSMRRLGRLPISQIERECARRAFTDQKVLPWGDIKKGSIGKRGPNIVARLLLEGKLTSTDRFKALSPKTEIFRSSDKQLLVPEWRS